MNNHSYIYLIVSVFVFTFSLIGYTQQEKQLNLKVDSGLFRIVSVTEIVSTSGHQQPEITKIKVLNSSMRNTKMIDLPYALEEVFENYADSSDKLYLRGKISQFVTVNYIITLDSGRIDGMFISNNVIPSPTRRFLCYLTNYPRTASPLMKRQFMLIYDVKNAGESVPINYDKTSFPQEVTGWPLYPIDFMDSHEAKFELPVEDVICPTWKPDESGIIFISRVSNTQDYSLVYIDLSEGIEMPTINTKPLDIVALSNKDQLPERWKSRFKKEDLRFLVESIEWIDDKTIRLMMDKKRPYYDDSITLSLDKMQLAFPK